NLIERILLGPVPNNWERLKNTRTRCLCEMLSKKALSFRFKNKDSSGDGHVHAVNFALHGNEDVLGGILKPFRAQAGGLGSYDNGGGMGEILGVVGDGCLQGSAINVELVGFQKRDDFRSGADGNLVRKH